MPMPLSQMVDILKDAMVQGVNDALVQSITKPAIRQDLYHTDTLTSPSNEQMKEKYFSTKDRLLIADVKASVYNHLCSSNPMPMRLLENAIVAGGCFTSLLHTKSPNDYDIFILQDDPNRNILYHKITAFMNGEWKQTTDMGYLQNPNIDTVFTYEHVAGYHIKFQYIFTKFKTREELINDFDFVHCCTSMTIAPSNLHLYITPSTYDAIRNKVLTKNPKCNRLPRQWRVKKFVEQGWKNNVLKTCD